MLVTMVCGFQEVNSGVFKVQSAQHFRYDSILFTGPTGPPFFYRLGTTGADVSRLFAVDGAFEWYVGSWGDCNGTCSDSGNDFIFRHRQVGPDRAFHQ